MYLYFLGLLFVTLVAAGNGERLITTIKHSKIRLKPTGLNVRAASHAQIPYLASFKTVVNVKKGPTVWKNICGGTIISETSVITAAHCFDSDNFFYVRYPHLLRLVAGHLAALIEVHEEDDLIQWRKVETISIHPNYHFPMNDIALAKVDNPWVLDEEVHVIKLTNESDDKLKNCVTAGYVLLSRGSSVGENLSEPPLTAVLFGDINIIPKAICSLQYEMDMDNFICSNSFMNYTPVKNASDDLGGPLVCEEYTPGSFVPEGESLVGIVCGKSIDQTLLFTRVSKYQDFITSAENDEGPDYKLTMYGNIGSRKIWSGFSLIILTIKSIL